MTMRIERSLRRLLGGGGSSAATSSPWLGFGRGFSLVERERFRGEREAASTRVNWEGLYKLPQAFTSKERGMGTAMAAPISLPTLLQRRRRTSLCSHPPGRDLNFTERYFSIFFTTENGCFPLARKLNFSDAFAHKSHLPRYTTCVKTRSKG